MAYTPQQKETILNSIFNDIENGLSLRKSLLKQELSSKTFYEWIEDDAEKVKQYARATEMRAEALLDEMLEIADENNADVYIDDTGEAKIDGNTVQRSRLQYDARKWLASKLNPKKYGDRMQHANDPDNPLTQMVDLSKIPTSVLIELENAGIKTE